MEADKDKFAGPALALYLRAAVMDANAAAIEAVKKRRRGSGCFDDDVREGAVTLGVCLAADRLGLQASVTLGAVDSVIKNDKSMLSRAARPFSRLGSAARQAPAEAAAPSAPPEPAAAPVMAEHAPPPMVEFPPNVPRNIADKAKHCVLNAAHGGEKVPVPSGDLALVYRKSGGGEPETDVGATQQQQQQQEEEEEEQQQQQQQQRRRPEGGWMLACIVCGATRGTKTFALRPDTVGRHLRAGPHERVVNELAEVDDPDPHARRETAVSDLQRQHDVVHVIVYSADPQQRQQQDQGRGKRRRGSGVGGAKRRGEGAGEAAAAAAAEDEDEAARQARIAARRALLKKRADEAAQQRAPDIGDGDAEDYNDEAAAGTGALTNTGNDSAAGAGGGAAAAHEAAAAGPSAAPPADRAFTDAERLKIGSSIVTLCEQYSVVTVLKLQAELRAHGLEGLGDDDDGGAGARALRALLTEADAAVSAGRPLREFPLIMFVAEDDEICLL
jgi:hypothetical protein